MEAQTGVVFPPLLTKDNSLLQNHPSSPTPASGGLTPMPLRLRRPSSHTTQPVSKVQKRGM